MGRYNSLADILLTSIVPVIWGSTYLVTTELLPAHIPLIAAMLRALPAGLIIMLFNRQFPQGQWWLRSILLGGLNIAAFFYFLFVAAYYLPGGIAALIMSIQPIIIMFYNALFFKRPVTITQVVASIIACIGVTMIVFQDNSAFNIIGFLAGISAALSMATGIALTKYWGRPDNVSVITFTGWQLSLGGLILLPIAVASESLPTHITFNNITGFTYLTIIGALLSYILWFKGIEKLPILSVSFISLLSPLSATFLGYLFLSQTLNTIQIFGGISVILSIILVQYKNHPSSAE